MSVSKEMTDNPVEGGESSDQSLSDSWTVLDSSHFKEDGDLSDAESVEVLNEALASDDICFEDKFHKHAAFQTNHVSFDLNENVHITRDEVEMVASMENSEEPPIDEVNENTSDSAGPSSPLAKKPPPKRKHLLDGCPIQTNGGKFTSWFLEIAIYSLFVDLILISYFGLTSLIGLMDVAKGTSHLRYEKSEHNFDVDPLSLQLSHVLAGWKKHPLEDHSLDRHVLKTLLQYYSGSNDVRTSVFGLSDKVSKYNDVIKRLGKEQDWTDGTKTRMVVSAHIAHAVACILGKTFDEKVVPSEYFNNVTLADTDDLAPEPGFWLNDWYLPIYVSVNDSYFRVHTKPTLPPLRQHLYMHLNDPDWDEYFWSLYHPDGAYENVDANKTHNANWSEDDNELPNEPESYNSNETNVQNKNTEEHQLSKKKRDVKGLVTFAARAEKVAESELDSEETQRSPLDLPILPADLRHDLPSVEESSGNAVDYTDESNEDFDSSYISLDSEEDDDNFLSAKIPQKGQFSGSLFEMLDDHDISRGNEGQSSRYEYTGSVNVRANEVEKLRKGKLSQLFEELAAEEHQNSKQSKGHGKPVENLKAGRLMRLFKELDNEELQDEENFGLFSENEAYEYHQDSTPSEETFNDKFFGDPKRSLMNKFFEELSDDELSMKDVFPGLFDKGISDELSEELALNESQNEDTSGRKLNDVEPQKEKKIKKKGGKRKFQSEKLDTEKYKAKNKQKKRDKARSATGKTESDSNKKQKRKDKKDFNSFGKDVKGGFTVKFDDNIPGPTQELKNRKKRFSDSDWNTRMAEGREKLRALSEKGDDQIWVFERARARRDMREEAFSE